MEIYMRLRNNYIVIQQIFEISRFEQEIAKIGLTSDPQLRSNTYLKLYQNLKR